MTLTKSLGAPTQSVFGFGCFILVKIWHLIAFYHRWFRKLPVPEIVLSWLSIGTMHLFPNRHTHANTQRQTFVQLNRKWGFLLSPAKSKIRSNKTALKARVWFLNGRAIIILIWGHPSWIHSTALTGVHRTQLYNILTPFTAFVLPEKENNKRKLHFISMS